MSEKTLVEIEENEAALILSEDGKISLYMPKNLKENEEEDLPPNVYFLASIAALLAKDDEIFNYVSERASELINDLEQEE